MFSSQVDNSEGIAQNAIAEALVLIEKINESKTNKLATPAQVEILNQHYLSLSQKLYDIYIDNPSLSIETKRTIIKTLFDLARIHNPSFTNNVFSPKSLEKHRLPEVLALSYFEIFLKSVSTLEGNASDVAEYKSFLLLSTAMKLKDTQLKAYFAGVQVWPKDELSFDQLFYAPEKFIPERWNAVIDAVLQLDLSEIINLSLGYFDLYKLNEAQWNNWMAGLKNIILHLKNIQITTINTQAIIDLSLSRRTALLLLFKDVPLLLDVDFSMATKTVTKEALAQQKQLCLQEDEEGKLTLTLKGNRLSCNSNAIRVLLNPTNEISHLCLDYQDYQLEFSEWEKFLTLVSQSCVIDLKLEGNSYQIPPAVREKLNKHCINHSFQESFLRNIDGSVQITDVIDQENLITLLSEMALNPYHPAKGLKYFIIDFSNMDVVDREGVDDSPFNKEKIEKVFILFSRLMLSNVEFIDFSEEMLRNLNDATWKYFIEQLSLLLLKLPSLKEIFLRNADGIDIDVPPTRLIDLISAFSQTKDCVFRINPILLNSFSEEQVKSLSICLQEASASILIDHQLLDTVYAELTNVNPGTDKILYPIFEKLQAYKIPIPATCTLLDTEVKPFFAMVKADIFSFLSIKELKINKHGGWIAEKHFEKLHLEDLCKGLEASGIHTLSIDKDVHMTSAMREKIKKILLKNAQTYALAHVNLQTGILFSIWSKVTDKNIDEKKKEALLSKLRECPDELHEQYYHLPYSHMKM